MTVDGVSVTYGQQGHRKHVWTFAGAKGESYQGNQVCPCTNTCIRIPPGLEQTTFVRLGRLHLKRVSSTNRIHSGMAKGVDPQVLVAGTISHHGFASSCQK